MALGTPVAAAAAYSASGGTSVTPAYPTGILATDVVLLFVGQKPSAANGGTVTTPTGWTLRDSLTAAGGYGTTLGADTGNTNLFVYSWDTPVAGQTGNLSVTLGTNGVAWAFMVRIPTGGGTDTYGSADGQRTTAPTAGTPFTVALTNGASPTAFQAGDLAIWAMCIPTDVTTPAQFSSQSVTATGATFGTAVEINEPDSATGNDIGGYSAYASVTAGSSTAAPSVTVTAGGTVTNVRGPVVLVRVRETAPPSQTLTQNTTFTNTNSFFGPAVTNLNTLSPALYTNDNTFFGPTVTSSITISPALYTNTNVFYGPVITQTGGTQTLTPALFTNTNSFFAASLTASNELLPALYTNTNTFYGATVTSTATLTPALYSNTNVFYSATVSSASTLLPDLYTNQNQFFGPVIQIGTTIFPALYENTNDFFGPSVSSVANILPDLFINLNAFYGPTVSVQDEILPDTYVNQNQFFSATVTSAYTLTLGPYVDDGYVDPWYIGLSLQNVNQFYSPVVTKQVMATGNMFTMFFP